jgi:hypothetical protein
MSSNSGLHRRRSFLSPPHPSRAPCPVPLPGGIGLHLRCHVTLLRDLLLNSQLLVALVLWFSPDVSEACLLVLINVEDSFSFYRGAFNLVRRQRCIDLLLLRRLRRPSPKARRREQRRGIAGSHLCTAGKKERGGRGEENNDRRIKFLDFHIFVWISCCELRVAAVDVDATISLAFAHLILNNADDRHKDGAAHSAARDIAKDAGEVHRTAASCCASHYHVEKRSS